MEAYSVIGKIGEGAHGVVMKAVNNKAEEVAIKKILLKKISDTNNIPTSIIREIKTLQELDHPYIIKLLDAFPSGLDFILVFDYMPSGLGELLKDSDKPLSVSKIKQYFQMLLLGVNYMHKKQIIHRDLKPANLLINKDGILKIGDFGLARLMWDDYSRPYSHQVATRWYRAPELLYGAKFYTSSVDMWSVGCIFGEMINNSPLFPGETDIEQLAIVLKQLGTPTAETWPEMTSLPDYNKITFPYHKGVPLEQILAEACSDALDIIHRLLVYNSAKRLTVSQVLVHPYFYTPPFPCPINQLPKPHQSHRNQLKPKEVDANLRITGLFKDLFKVT